METNVTRLSLLSRVRDSSNEAAWAEFESRYRDLILRYALARGLQHADAEDVSQIVFLSLSRALRGFQYSPQKGRFRDYLGRTVRNAVARFRARPNPAPLSLDALEGLADEERGDDHADALWEQQWVDHHYRLALRTVRETFDRKSVEIFERLIEGREVCDVAVEFATTKQAVHKIKQRIRARMEELIVTQVQEEDAVDDSRPQ